MFFDDINIVYKKYSGLLHINVYDFIDKHENKGEAFKKLIWNIPNGRLRNEKARNFLEFAELICQLAVIANVNINDVDFDKNGIITEEEKLIFNQLQYIHQFIELCEHIGELLRGLLIDNSDSNEKSFLLTDGENVDKIIAD